MKIRFTLLLLVVLSIHTYAQSDRKLVVLNMNNYNAETNNSRYYSALKIARFSGVAFDTTSDVNIAVNYPVILFGSRIMDQAFNTTEKSLLDNYVSNGGVMIHSSPRDADFFGMCGVSASNSSDQLYWMNWDTAAMPQAFYMFDDSMEVQIKLGDTAVGANFYTRYFDLTSGTSLARYEDSTVAVVHHHYGNGEVYTFGPDFRDVIMRNEMDMDNNAHREYSNGFEPGSDVFVFMIRNLIRKHIPNLVYKHTAPGNAESVFILTHDIDSWSGMDTMHLFSAFEKSAGIVAQYNITTRYFNDGWMSSFYVGSWSRVEGVMVDGHVIASHSVGHFPDFDDETRFPYGTTGNIPAHYQPHYSGGVGTGMTTGGTVLGELEVSKNLLQDDHSVGIRSFRAGHLCYPDSLILGLEQLGYEYNSTMSANNILTSYPFYHYKTRSFSAEESTILEIPMTISDVFAHAPIDSSNYMQKVSIWADCIRRYHRNSAPVTLLIHPNRTWKLIAEEAIVDSLPAGVIPFGFEQYGDYWRKRDSLEYHTGLNGDTLFVQMDNNYLSELQSFIIDPAGIDTVIFYNVNGAVLQFDWQNYAFGLRLYYPHQSPDGIQDIKKKNVFVRIYPNPASNELFIQSSEAVTGNVKLYDLQGRLYFETNIRQQQYFRIDLSQHHLSEGIYFLAVPTGETCSWQKVMILSR